MWRCLHLLVPVWYLVLASGHSIAFLLHAGCGTDGIFQHTSFGSPGGLHPQQDAPHKCGYAYPSNNQSPAETHMFPLGE